LYILKAYVTLEIVKYDKCPKREWASDDMFYPIKSKLRNHTQLCPTLYTYDMFCPIHSKLRNHTQLCPLLYTYDMVFPIHSKLGNQTQVCNPMLLNVWDHCV
jgi:hypothetical protein